MEHYRPFHYYFWLAFYMHAFADPAHIAQDLSVKPQSYARGSKILTQKPWFQLLLGLVRGMAWQLAHQAHTGSWSFANTRQEV